MQVCSRHASSHVGMTGRHYAAKGTKRLIANSRRPASACCCQRPSHTIRAAIPDDLQRIVQIEQLCCEQAGTQWSATQFQEEMDRPYAHVLVVSQPGDNDPAGFIVAWLLAGELQILHLAVDPAYQGRGLGVSVVQNLLQLCGCYVDADAILEVRDGNAPALSLYRKLGFQEVGRRRRYYADGSDAVLMTRPPGPLST